ncbi:MAG: Nif3-like dinuclear metal center hexameric protein [Candidatus Gastranaerophilales bacterium]
MMNKYEIIKKIENFAPLELAEAWDCSGWLVETNKTDVRKIMLALTVTEKIYEQAISSNCDMIISHHPLFNIPIEFKNIDIYCSHTNLDKAQGGTTDTLIKALELDKGEVVEEFLRIVEIDLSVSEFCDKLQKITKNLRLVNNNQAKKLSKIAFCAGSGGEFERLATDLKADGFVTGDLKFHQALDSKIVLFDIGHFESEVLILPVIAEIIGNEVEIIFAKETSPFRHFNQ